MNEDDTDDMLNGMVDADVAEAMFPGCVERAENGTFTMKHGKLARRFVTLMKATSSMTKEEFFHNLWIEWDQNEIEATYD
jgi:hypothetical protein